MQAVELSWHPQARFFDLRSEILGGLEKDGLMEAFQWENGGVLVRLSQFEGFRVTFNGATCWITSPTAQLEGVRETLARFLDPLEADNVRVKRAYFRYLFQILGMDPVDAQCKFAAEVSGEVAPVGFPVDAALVLDGIDAESKTSFQVEYGVVGPEEISERLRGLGVIPLMQSPFAPDLDDTSTCALFLSWFWTLPTVEEGGDRIAAEREWDRLISKSNAMSTNILSRHKLDNNLEGRKQA